MLSNFLLIYIGGAIGSLLRYRLSLKMKPVAFSHFPVATFFINIIGSFLLGALLAEPFSESAKFLLGTGFLGGFTTFSTFQVENIKILRQRRFGTFLAYTSLSVLLCLASVAIGYKFFNFYDIIIQ